jgi:hypothetical protein
MMTIQKIKKKDFFVDEIFDIFNNFLVNFYILFLINDNLNFNVLQNIIIFYYKVYISIKFKIQTENKKNNKIYIHV